MLIILNFPTSVGNETSNYELEFETKSGQIRYLLVNATTRRDAENNVIGVVGVAQDVTESTKNDRAMSAMARELVSYSIEPLKNSSFPVH